MANAVDQNDDGKVRLPKLDGGMNKLGPTKGSSAKDRKILQRARKRFDKCIGRESDNRKKALECLKNINGEQWSSDDLKARAGRPTITENHLRVFVNQVANAQRENRPAINISPDGDRGDVQVAKMLKGVIRKMQRECNADIAYDTGYFYSCAMGWGWWRVATDYEGPNTFNQTIEVQRVRNPFTIYADPSSKEPDAADMKYCFVTELMDRKDFEDKYPNADPMNFEGVNTGPDYKEWIEDKKVRIAEYFEVHYEKTKLYALSNGWIGTDEEMHDDVREKVKAGTLTIENERDTEIPTVKWYKITAKEILERKDWPGKWIPLVKVIGNEIDIEGKVSLAGVINDAIEPQHRLNYWSSLETELLAMQPKAPWVMAEGQDEGHEAEWDLANTAAVNRLRYKPTTVDDKLAPPPQRQPFPGVPGGLVEGRNAASQAMMATTGIRFDATMHERLNDESGKALHEIRRATDIGTYHFIDNLSRSLIQTGRILVDLISNGKVMDVKRVMSIIREDDKEEQVQFDPNQSVAAKDVPHPTKQGQKILSVNPTFGNYSVSVTIGPDNATKRIEAVDNMMKVIEKIPVVGQVGADILIKNLDGEGMDELATRIGMTIPPHLKGDPKLKHLPPDAQALIGSLGNQVQQLAQHRMILMKALTEKNTEHALKKDKIDKDFAAKVMAILQKAQSSHQTDETARIGMAAAHIKDMLEGHVSLVEAQQGGEGEK